MSQHPKPEPSPSVPERIPSFRVGGDLPPMSGEDTRDNKEFMGDYRDPFVWRDTTYMVDKRAHERPSRLAMDFMWAMYRRRQKHPGEHDPAPKQRDSDLITDNDYRELSNERDATAIHAYGQYLVDTSPPPEPLLEPIEPESAQLPQNRPTTDETIHLGSFMSEAASTAKEIFAHLEEVDRMRREHPAYRDDHKVDKIDNP